MMTLPTLMILSLSQRGVFEILRLSPCVAGRLSASRGDVFARALAYRGEFGGLLWPAPALTTVE